MKHSKDEAPADDTTTKDTKEIKKEELLNIGSVPDARKALDSAPSTPDGLPALTAEEQEAADKRKAADERRHPPGIGTY